MENDLPDIMEKTREHGEPVDRCADTFRCEIRCKTRPDVVFPDPVLFDTRAFALTGEHGEDTRAKGDGNDLTKPGLDYGAAQGIDIPTATEAGGVGYLQDPGRERPVM